MPAANPANSPVSPSGTAAPAAAPTAKPTAPHARMADTIKLPATMPRLVGLRPGPGLVGVGIGLVGIVGEHGGSATLQTRKPAMHAGSRVPSAARAAYTNARACNNFVTPGAKAPGQCAGYRCERSERISEESTRKAGRGRPYMSMSAESHVSNRRSAFQW
jgi:hypothetical protein